MADLSFHPFTAPADMIQWFYAKLTEDNSKAQIFVDPTTEVEIIVCRNTPAIRTQLSTAAQPSPSHTYRSEAAPQQIIAIPACTNTTSGSETYGSELDEETITHLEHSHSSQTAPLPDPATLVHTTTSHNKTKEKRRVERKEKIRQVQDGRIRKTPFRNRRTLSAKTVHPETDEDADAESEGEDTDSVSNSMNEVSIEYEKVSRDKRTTERLPAEVTSWFAAAQVMDSQKGLISVATTSPRRVKMFQNAIAIAGVACAEEWQGYMRTWRENGHLTSRPTSRNQRSLMHLQNVSPEIRAFHYKYSRVEISDVIESWRAITHRIRQVDLWEAFLQAGHTIPSKDLGPLRNGQVVLSQQKLYLFGIIHPRYKGVERPETSDLCKKDWSTFTYQLRNATRWYTLQAELGYGILGLIPKRVISSSWVQRLNADEFPLWIMAIRKWNPTCLEISQVWTSTLRLAFSNRGPSRRLKVLEEIPPALLKKYGNMATLFSPGDLSEAETGSANGGDTTTPPTSQEVACLSQGYEWDMGLAELDSDLRFFGPDSVDFAELDLTVLNCGGVGTGIEHEL